MTTTTQTGTFDYTIPAEHYGDFAADYNTDAINDAVCDAINAMLPEGITIARNGMIFADVDKADEARELDFAELLAAVDVDAIVDAHEATK
jgi:hypothetical protein